MLSIRSVARSGARAVPRLAITTRVAIARPALGASAAVFVSRQSAFSTSAFFQAVEPAASRDTDTELSTKIQTELQFESEVKEEEAPASIQEFLANGPFKLVDLPGQDDVVLTRDFGDEKITIKFSIADLANLDPENEEDLFDDDEATEGEPKESQRSTEEAAADPENLETRPTCRLHIVIEKPGKSQAALSIETTISDDGMMIEGVFFYKQPNLAHTGSVESEFASQQVYPGPPFNSLDEDLQILMERFIEERGINESLGDFVTEYMEYKEQREYVSWLSNVKGFLDA